MALLHFLNGGVDDKHIISAVRVAASTFSDTALTSVCQ